ncbi:MAG: hypothetical protein ABSA83_08625 [Verrucomicrobiota bacterium]|jgi:hypothetical protein
MNRTILIVICDFLLVSLLAFSSADINSAANPTAVRTAADLASPGETNRIGGRQDLGDVMRLALEEERRKQDALSADLSKTQAAASRQQLLLNQRDAQLQAFHQQEARLQEEQTNLLRQMSLAQSNVQDLSQQLQVETVVSREQRAAQEAEIRKQQDKAAALQQQLSALEKSNQFYASQRALLANQLQLTETEKRAAAEQLAMAREDLNVQRQENAKLSQGVNVLAGKSSELAQEIRNNTSLAPNAIFDQFATNRVIVSFDGVRPGFFGGESKKDKETQTILANDGTNTFAVCHVQNTLLSLWDPGTPWRGLTGSISHGSAAFPLNTLSFFLPDPRVALMPVPGDAARELGCKVYRTSRDPYKFQDAVIIGARGAYYGQCQFQIDLTEPQYLKMDRNSLKGLFGKFNPSTGDLVFSKTGELLGVMANNTYCIIIHDFEVADTVRFAADTRDQPIADTLSSLYATVVRMPFKLQ